MHTLECAPLRQRQQSESESDRESVNIFTYLGKDIHPKRWGSEG